MKKTNLGPVAVKIDRAVQRLQKHRKQHRQHEFQELRQNRSLGKIVAHDDPSANKKAGQNSRHLSLRSYPALHFC